MVNLNFTEFSEQYSPIKNTLEMNTPCDGFLFLDKDQLRDVSKDKLWTLIENPIEDDMYITNGVFIINAHGWLVTRESWVENEVIEVRLEESDIKKEEDENN